MSDYKISIILDGPFTVGEVPFWEGKTQSLLFVYASLEKGIHILHIQHKEKYTDGTTILGKTERLTLVSTITKLPESGDLCGNITEFGVAEGNPPPPQTKRYFHIDLQTKVVLFLYPTV